MRIRKLDQKDASLMLEWMHDKSVVKDMQSDFVTKTLEDCTAFINASQDEIGNLNLAITDDDDTYLGTVSLKHITDSSAEFAITIRTVAMGKGVSNYAMSEIIRIGFEEYGLNKIYWCVNKVNKRAVRFYDKNGYQRVKIEESDMLNNILEIGRYTEEQIRSYIWYEVKIV